MMKKSKKHKGMLSVELVVAVSVLAILISVLATLNLSFGKLNHYLWAKHICYNAGQAQLDSIASIGKRIDDDTFEKLWPGVSCQLEISDGAGSWQGLKRIDLTLSKKIKRKTVQVYLTRYLPEDKGGIP
jgi:type II secretory pathway pseudopilin PulG